jgi:2-phosphosulfolactate phosphatase
MIYDQAEHAIRCEWGLQGVLELAPISDAIVIVDVLSFSTAVDIATARGAAVYPFGASREEAGRYAAALGAQLAGRYGDAARYSLSPSSLAAIPAGARLVLPSPNGSRLSLATGVTPTLTACLRNYRAVAAAAQAYGNRIAVIPAGERWPDGSLRPAVEDLIGAGAVIGQFRSSQSPEAAVALAAFRSAEGAIVALLEGCSSGKELIERGLAADVALASMLDASDCVPLLVDGAYRNTYV